MVQKYIRQLWKDLIHVLFPDLCLACNHLPKTQQASFCTECIYLMPYTDHFEIEENEVTQHFRGLVPIKHGAALLLFQEGNLTQRLLYQLKYQKKREVGSILGEIAGQKWLQSKVCSHVDLIVPVPIHPKKERLRSYNQSAVFGLAVSKILQVSCVQNVLIKSKENESQTGKNRAQRVENVSDVFKVDHIEMIKDKHVLLVDDVVTTGATAIACCQQLYKAGAKQVSILSISVAII